MSSLNLEHGRPTQSEHEYECLSTQLSLELRLRQNCQELLNLYKSTQDWSSVTQLAQSLITNTQRVTALKDQLSKVEQGGVRSFLHSISESKSPSPEQATTDFHQSENHQLSPAPEVSEIELLSEYSGTSLEGPPSFLDREEELNLLAGIEDIDNSTQLEPEACGKLSDCFENKRTTSSLESPPLSDERQLFACESEEAVAKDSLTNPNCDPNTFNKDSLSNKLYNESNEPEDKESDHTTIETHHTNSPVKSTTLAYSASSSRGGSNSDLFYSAPESLTLDTEQDNLDQEIQTPPKNQPLPSDSEDSTVSSEESVDNSLNEVIENQVATGNSEVPTELSEDQNNCKETSPTPPPDIVVEESSRETLFEGADNIDAAVTELDSTLLAIESTVADLLMADISDELSDQPLSTSGQIVSDDQPTSSIDRAVETSTVTDEGERTESLEPQTELSDEPCDKTEPIHPTPISMESSHEESDSNEQPPDNAAKNCEQIEQNQMTDNSPHESTSSNEPEDTIPSVIHLQNNSETLSTEQSSKEDSPADTPHDVDETSCEVLETPSSEQTDPATMAPHDVDETPCEVLETPSSEQTDPATMTPHDVDETPCEVLETPSSEQTDPTNGTVEEPSEVTHVLSNGGEEATKEWTLEGNVGTPKQENTKQENVMSRDVDTIEEEVIIVQDDVSDNKDISNNDGTCTEDPDVVSKLSSTEQNSDQITTETQSLPDSNSPSQVSSISVAPSESKGPSDPDVVSKLSSTEQNSDQITTTSPDSNSPSKVSQSISHDSVAPSESKSPSDHSSTGQDSVAPSESKSPSDHSSTGHKSSEEEPDISAGEEMAIKVDKKRRRSKALTNIKKKSVKLKQQLSNLGTGNKKREDDADAVPAVKPLSPIVGAEWDPTCLLEELYSDYRQGTRTAGKSGESARYFGYLQKLPMNKSKAAFTKGFKRRYFRAMEGKLYYYEERTVDKALGFVKLEHSRINPIPEKLQIQVIQKDGKSLMVKATDLDDLNTWYKNLNLEAAHPTQPTPVSPLSLHNRGVVIIDIGAASVRAGYASEDAYPELFFPAVATLDPSNQEDMGCGIAALQPETRFRALQVYPRRFSHRMDQRDANSQLRALDSIISYVVMALDFEPTITQLVLTLSPTVPETDRIDLIGLLFDRYQFAGLCVQEQAVLALYSYNTTTGIVVDIGDHIDIVPIIDGYVIEAGVTRLPFGGSAITESLSKLITARGIRYFSETESYIIRLIKESLCFVSEDYLETMGDCESNAVPYTNAMDMDRFQLPDHRKVITLDSDRFKAPEGLFSPSLWGKDVVGLHDHVWKAIQACSIDQRKQVAKSIYLSGGCTLLPGLQERLQKELNVLAGSGLPVEVHAGPARQHAAFIGASVLSSLGTFSRVNVVTLEEWCESGVDALNKWKAT